LEEQVILEAILAPKWCVVDGYRFTREDLLATPRWWWRRARKQAWWRLHLRRKMIEEEAREGWINPLLCWPELRLFLVEGDPQVLDYAREKTRIIEEAGRVARLVKLRTTPELLPQTE
jgi:hypothetical protein